MQAAALCCTRIHLCLLSFLFAITSVCASEKPHFVVVTPSYNNERWVTKNLESVLSQTYADWSMIYVDDCSTDRTATLVEQFIDAHGLHKRCKLIRNSTRCLQLANIYHAVHSCRPTDIIVILDGDDWLAHSRVFETLAAVYADKRVWLTYGNFQSDPPGWASCCHWIPVHVRKNNAFRKHRWSSSHLRTFYAKLFQMIRKEDLQIGGKFIPMATDMAAMFPMLEMAAKHHFRFIREVLYIYNVSNPLMHHHVNAQLQHDLDVYVRSLPPYKALDALW